MRVVTEPLRFVDWIGIFFGVAGIVIGILAAAYFYRRAKADLDRAKVELERSSETAMQRKIQQHLSASVAQLAASLLGKSLYTHLQPPTAIPFSPTRPRRILS